MFGHRRVRGEVVTGDVPYPNWWGVRFTKVTKIVPINIHLLRSFKVYFNSVQITSLFLHKGGVPVDTPLGLRSYFAI